MSRRIAWTAAPDKRVWRSTEHRFRIEQTDARTYVADDLLTDAMAIFPTLQDARDWCNQGLAADGTGGEG